MNLGQELGRRYIGDFRIIMEKTNLGVGIPKAKWQGNPSLWGGGQKAMKE